MEKNPPRLPGYQLPTQPHVSGGRMAEGFFTPTQDLMPQVISIPPKRVLPIIFLPGIMGSNLRMSAARQAEMKKKNNIAWRPESLAEAKKLIGGNSILRQNQLDPSQTEVDEYDPVRNPTGNTGETADQRHDNAEVHFELLNVGIDTPLLMDDPVTTKPRKMKEQKARERGWGEVFFGSYQALLEMCEQRLNTAFYYGHLDSWWKQIVDVPPARWQASPQPPLKPLEEKTLRDTVTGCWFPVHAMGYNWLQSNQDSGIYVAKRITALMKRYKAQGFQCEKVIVVTHSMGGLVARALIHPEMGKLREQVLGIVHGVMPAIGAGAAYKRMRCGFEDPGLMSMSPIASITAKVLGNFGSEVTAVLGNAPGGLELLPSQTYGNGWLQVTHNGQMIKALPQQGDPYEEVYKLRGKWYGLLREEWINPAKQKSAGFDRSARLLDQAKAFHNAIASTYHDQSYAHYGADPGHAAWRNVVWAIGDSTRMVDLEKLQVATDNLQGKLHLVDPKWTDPTGTAPPGLEVKMQPASDPGDQTVPLHSAEHQLQSGKFKGIFRQTGYEHQDSYKNEGALHSTLYSLVRIAQTMTWTTK
jgi:pimeloyl-ACP methyl ester carboxylesterase